MDEDLTRLGQKLSDWLATHDNNLQRFSVPLSIATLSQEIAEYPDAVVGFLRSRAAPPYHVWRHNTSRSKPYCLRLNGPDTVGLDWEESVVGAAEAEFRRRGFQTIREFGTQDQVRSLGAHSDLSTFQPGRNLRDLWALRKNDQEVELFIIEAKGKQTFELDHYCFAELLSQVFVVSGNYLSELLGAKKNDSHGLCWQYAQQIHHAWMSTGLSATITVAVLVPAWSPDVVWSAGKPRLISGCFYTRPLDSFCQFLSGDETPVETNVFKYQQAFAAMLQDLQANYDLRALAKTKKGLRFRLMTTRLEPRTGQFILTGLEL